MGPVIITDRGKPVHVLPSIAQYQEHTGGAVSIVDLLGDQRAGEIDFSPPRVADSSLKVPQVPQ
jgi:hypothetical protein